MSADEHHLTSITWLACNPQDHLVVLAAAKTLTSELLPQWFRQPLSSESREAAARAAATFEGIDWDALGCCCPKPQALFLQGALTLLAAHPPPVAAGGPARRRAAELLEAAVKLQPSLVDAWNCLGGLASSAGELVMALHCLSSGLTAAVTVEGLRQMSIVSRRLAASTGALPLERQEAVSASIAAAKQAVSMDVSDGFSWYVLGMAHVAASSALPAAAKPTSTSSDQATSTPASTSCSCSSSDSSSKQPIDTHAASEQHQQCDAASSAARAALAAFTAAGRCGLWGLPELWFNRAAVALHLGELGSALQDFSTAAEMDPSLPAAAQVCRISQLLSAVTGRLGQGREAGLAPSQAAGLQASLAADLSSGAAQQLLPPGWHLTSWQQQQQQQQRHPTQKQHQPTAAVAAAQQVAGSSNGRRASASGGNTRSSSGGGKSANSSSGSSSSEHSAMGASGSNSSGQSKRALHCRIAAVFEKLPGCAQWVCIAMSPCGACFPLMLPGSTPIPAVVGCCLLLLQPTVSHIILPAGWGGQASNKAVHLAVVRVSSAGSLLVSGSSSSSTTADSTGEAAGIAGQDCCSQADVSLRTTLILGNAAASNVIN